MNINPWRSTSVRTALKGLSFIDTKRIHIHCQDEAQEFLECYGFDLNDPVDAEEVENIRLEAIELIEQELLEDGEAIPQQLKDEHDIRQYLLIASGRGNRTLATWSGAILRVLHTLTHSYSYLDDIYHDAIRDQIFSRFNKHIRQQGDEYYLGDIKLFTVDFRASKTRRSAAMKLLHKAENVAADIFDWIGIRFITEYRADVLDVLAFLREKHIVTYANLKPSRSRNTLIDLEWINQCMNNGESIDDIRQQMQTITYPKPSSQQRAADSATSTDNPFSEISYQSVQITCRQRIKILQPDGRKLCFYFPFEIQMMDKDSYQKSREGLASHGEYKKRQRAAVRKRVLPFL